MNTVGIIPARGGSKSIPRKNLRILNGKPLIAWAIEAAKKSKLSRVIVTTDDEEIARTARQYGAETPFLRPAELAEDTTAIEPVLQHAYTWLREKEGYVVNALALLMPTNPLRRPEHINEAIDIFASKQVDCVISVHEAIANRNPYWILKRNDRGEIVLSTGEPLMKIKDRRQELPPHFVRNDIVFVFKPANLFEEKPNLYGKKVELYEMDEWFDVDINTENDWQLCLFKMSQSAQS